MPPIQRDHAAGGSSGYLWLFALGLLVIAFGLPIFLGGLWLIGLGGSWYYGFAGLGLLLTAYFLFRPSMAALWVYLVTYAGTVVWALWEKGFDWWAQVPRLVAPTVVLLLVLICLPILRRCSRHKRDGRL
ncbi:quinoprotein glucose dehydrogenase [Rhodoligotrophos appendicifer]|uniref:glucose dehydrogenase n=1 Tax=Rhodoligotrophos appendicifer TaxID=987056 RepID=UPI001185B019|nr:glucose dehydrogenase [Rhodoligotrophos appendicifer]